MGDYLFLIGCLITVFNFSGAVVLTVVKSYGGKLLLDVAGVVGSYKEVAFLPRIGQVVGKSADSLENLSILLVDIVFSTR
jgi:hypothetical protein